MNDIEEDLTDYLCKKCKYLSYYDYYRCDKEKGKLNDCNSLGNKTVKKCSFFKERIGCTHNEKYKDCECVFWCNNCNFFNKK